MAIAPERPTPTYRFATYDPYEADPRAVVVSRLNCHYCGFEPEDHVVAPSRCPKCLGHSWERFVRPVGPPRLSRC
jgi:hypothetical protein